MKKITLALLIGAVGLSGMQFAQAKEATWITDKPLNLTIHVHARNKYIWDTDAPVNKEIGRLTNVMLKGTGSKTATNSVEQFNLMMASGALPDIVGGDSLKDNFIRYGMEGAFVPLNKLIEQHAPNLKAFFKSHPAALKSITAPDGNIYYIPYIPDGTIARGWWIRQDWLAKLKLKEPKNINELHTVLKAFREKDPNGNGQKDEVPFFSRDPEQVFHLLNFWGCRATGSDSALDFYVDGGKIKHPFAEPCLKTGMKNLAQWYKDGLIDTEIFTRKNRAREQLYGNNNGGLTFDWFASTAAFNTSISKTVPGFNLVAIAPPADVNGKVWLENTRAQVKPDGWAITYVNKNPVETIKLFDFMFSRKGRDVANFGVEGLTYEYKNGKAVFKDAVLNNSKSVTTQLWEIGAQLPIGFWQDYEYERQWTIPEALVGIDMYTKGNWGVEDFYGVNMTKEERTVFDANIADIKTYMTEMAQNWILGTKDVDASWADYQAQLKKKNLDKVIAVMQKAYDRQYKK